MGAWTTQQSLVPVSYQYRLRLPEWESKAVLAPLDVRGFGFAGVGGPIVGGNIVHVSEAEAAIAGLHHFYAVRIPQLVFDAGAATGRTADGGCSAEGCGIDSGLSGAGTKFVGARFVVPGVLAVAAVNGAVIRAQMQRAEKQGERSGGAGQADGLGQHNKWIAAGAICFAGKGTRTRRPA
jgi:hypothetical protein